MLVVTESTDTCIRFCENYNVSTNLKVNINPIERFPINPQDRFPIKCNEVANEITFDTLCQFCWYYKNYSYYKCVFFEGRGNNNWNHLITPNKKCVVCKHLGKNTCPLFDQDRFLLKRLYQSFHIRLHIPDEEQKQLTEGSLFNQ